MNISVQDTYRMADPPSDPFNPGSTDPDPDDDGLPIPPDPSGGNPLFDIPFDTVTIAKGIQ
jgi:hypothetical protein